MYDPFCSLKLKIATFDRLGFVFVQRYVVVKHVSVTERYFPDNQIHSYRLFTDRWYRRTIKSKSNKDYFVLLSTARALCVGIRQRTSKRTNFLSANCDIISVVENSQPLENCFLKALFIRRHGEFVESSVFYGKSQLAVSPAQHMLRSFISWQLLKFIHSPNERLGTSYE